MGLRETASSICYGILRSHETNAEREREGGRERDVEGGRQTDIEVNK